MTRRYNGLELSINQGVCSGRGVLIEQVSKNIKVLGSAIVQSPFPIDINNALFQKGATNVFVFPQLNGNSDLILRNFCISPLSTKGEQKTVEYEMQQQLPFHIKDAYWDYRVLNKNGNITNITGLATKKILVQNYLDLTKEIGIKPHSMISRYDSILSLLSKEPRLENALV